MKRLLGLLLVMNKLETRALKYYQRDAAQLIHGFFDIQ